MLGRKCALIKLPTKTITKMPGVRKPHTGHSPITELMRRG